MMNMLPVDSFETCDDFLKNAWVLGGEEHFLNYCGIFVL